MISSCARRNGIDPVFAVEGDGKYREDWLWLGGQGSVINPKFNAPDGPINTDLREAGALLAASFDYQHSYPHSWRSKAKVIYRCTPQWFVAMDKPLGHHHFKTRAEKRWENEGGALIDGAHVSDDESATLRQLAMTAIAETRFVPEKGRNRIGSMVEGRPDWVLSRQRAWGVPIALFVERKTGKLLVDHEVNERIVAAIKAEGVDAWDDDRAQEYLGNSYDAADYERVTDILDVWFDSGCTHVFVLESGHWPEQRWPADLYLEGSDQHRGWFQSSLLESCGTRGRAPYDAVLTHGFTMDSKGMKMSKSLGNTIRPDRPDARLWRGHPAAVGAVGRLHRGPSHRQGDPRRRRPTSIASSGTPSATCSARSTGSARKSGSAVDEMPELERYMLALTARARREAAAGGRRFRLQHLCPRADRLLQRRSFGLLLRYPQGQPLLRCAERPEAPRLSHGARHAVPRAGPLGRAGAGVHQPRKCGARAIPMRKASTCSNGRKSTPPGATMRWRRNGLRCANCASQ